MVQQQQQHCANNGEFSIFHAVLRCYAPCVGGALMTCAVVFAQKDLVAKLPKIPLTNQSTEVRCICLSAAFPEQG